MYWYVTNTLITILDHGNELYYMVPYRKESEMLLKALVGYDPAIPLLVIYPKECDTRYNRGTCTPMFIAALLQ
jgi:hypothetical protein